MGLLPVHYTKLKFPNLGVPLLESISWHYLAFIQSPVETGVRELMQENTSSLATAIAVSNKLFFVTNPDCFWLASTKLWQTNLLACKWGKNVKSFMVLDTKQ